MDTYSTTYSTQHNDQAVLAVLSALIPMICIFVVAMYAIVVIPFWQIFKKAGMAAPLSLLMIVPLLNLIVLYILAFSRWKVVPAPDFASPAFPPPYPPAGYVAPPATAASPAYQPPPPPAPPAT